MPKVVDHAKRRAEIIDATWRALAEDGIEGATMRRIAEHAGCTTGRLNHYFASRDEILVASLRRVHDDAARRMAGATADRTGRDALRAVLVEALPLDDVRRREWIVWLAFWSQAAADERLRAGNEARYDEWRSFVRDLVQACVPDGRRRARTARTADLLVALVDGLGTQATLATAGGAAAARRLEDAVDLAIDSLLPDPD